MNASSSSPEKPKRLETVSKKYTEMRQVVSQPDGIASDEKVELYDGENPIEESPTYSPKKNNIIKNFNKIMSLDSVQYCESNLNQNQHHPSENTNREEV